MAHHVPFPMLPLRRVNSCTFLSEQAPPAHEVPVADALPGFPIVTVDDLHSYGEYVTADEMAEVFPTIDPRNPPAQDAFHDYSLSLVFGQMRLVSKYRNVCRFVHLRLRNHNSVNDAVKIAREVAPDVLEFVRNPDSAEMLGALIDRIPFELRHLLCRPFLADFPRWMRHPFACVVARKIIRKLSVAELRQLAAAVDAEHEMLILDRDGIESVKQYVRRVSPGELPQTLQYLVDRFHCHAVQTGGAELLEACMMRANGGDRSAIDAFANSFFNREYVGPEFDNFVLAMIRSYQGNRTLQNLFRYGNREDCRKIARLLASAFPYLLLEHGSASLASLVLDYADENAQTHIAANLAMIDNDDPSKSQLYTLLCKEDNAEIARKCLLTLNPEARMHVMVYLNQWYDFFCRTCPHAKALLDTFLWRRELIPTGLVWRELAPGFVCLGLPFEAQAPNVDNYIVDVAHVMRRNRPYRAPDERHDIPVVPVIRARPGVTPRFPDVFQVRGTSRLVVRDPVLRFFNGSGVDPRNNSWTFDHVRGRFMAFASDPHGSEFLYHKITDDANPFNRAQQMAMMEEFLPFSQVAIKSDHICRIMQQLVLEGNHALRDLYATYIDGALARTMFAVDRGCQMAFAAVTRHDFLANIFKDAMMDLLQHVKFTRLPECFKQFLACAFRVLLPVGIFEEAVYHMLYFHSLYEIAAAPLGTAVLASVLARPPSQYRFLVMQELVLDEAKVLQAFHDPNLREIIAVLFAATSRESADLYNRLYEIVRLNVETVFKAPHSRDILRVMFATNTAYKNRSLFRWIMQHLPTTTGDHVARRYTEGDAAQRLNQEQLSPVALGCSTRSDKTISQIDCL